MKLIVGSVLLVLLLSSCGPGPEQNAGELWLYERGKVRCIDITHLSARSPRWFVYTLADGTEHDVYGPLEFYAGSECSHPTTVVHIDADPLAPR